MNAFMMIILTVLLEGIFKLPNGRQNQMIQTFEFDGFDKAFGITIQIRTSSWEFYWLYPRALQNIMESYNTPQKLGA